MSELAEALRFPAARALEYEAVAMEISRGLDGDLATLAVMAETLRWEDETRLLRELAARLRCRRSDAVDVARLMRAAEAER